MILPTYNQVRKMTPLEAYKVVNFSVNVLLFNWVVNNILGFVSLPILAYLTYWKWDLGLLISIPVVLLGLWLINSMLLPKIFAVVNKPFANVASHGAIRLATLKVIDDQTAEKLSATKVEHWIRIINEKIDFSKLNQKSNSDSVKGEGVSSEYSCACGKYQGSRYKDILCDTCNKTVRKTA